MRGLVICVLLLVAGVSANQTVTPNYVDKCGCPVCPCVQGHPVVLMDAAPIVAPCPPGTPNCKSVTVSPPSQVLLTPAQPVLPNGLPKIDPIIVDSPCDGVNPCNRQHPIYAQPVMAPGSSTVFLPTDRPLPATYTVDTPYVMGSVPVPPPSTEADVLPPPAEPEYKTEHYTATTTFATSSPPPPHVVTAADAVDSLKDFTTIAPALSTPAATTTTVSTSTVQSVGYPTSSPTTYLVSSPSIVSTEMPHNTEIIFVKPKDDANQPLLQHHDHHHHHHHHQHQQEQQDTHSVHRVYDDEDEAKVEGDSDDDDQWEQMKEYVGIFRRAEHLPSTVDDKGEPNLAYPPQENKHNLYHDREHKHKKHKKKVKTAKNTKTTTTPTAAPTAVVAPVDVDAAQKLQSADIKTILGDESAPAKADHSTDIKKVFLELSATTVPLSTPDYTSSVQQAVGMMQTIRGNVNDIDQKLWTDIPTDERHELVATRNLYVQQLQQLHDILSTSGVDLGNQFVPGPTPPPPNAAQLRKTMKAYDFDKLKSLTTAQIKELREYHWQKYRKDLARQSNDRAYAQSHHYKIVDIEDNEEGAKAATSSAELAAKDVENMNGRVEKQVDNLQKSMIDTAVKGVGEALHGLQEHVDVAHEQGLETSLKVQQVTQQLSDVKQQVFAATAALKALKVQHITALKALAQEDSRQKLAHRHMENLAELQRQRLQETVDKVNSLTSKLHSLREQQRHQSASAAEEIDEQRERLTEQFNKYVEKINGQRLVRERDRKTAEHQQHVDEMKTKHSQWVKDHKDKEEEQKTFETLDQKSETDAKHFHREEQKSKREQQYAEEKEKHDFEVEDEDSNKKITAQQAEHQKELTEAKAHEEAAKSELDHRKKEMDKQLEFTKKVLAAETSAEVEKTLAQAAANSAKAKHEHAVEVEKLAAEQFEKKQKAQQEGDLKHDKLVELSEQITKARRSAQEDQLKQDARDQKEMELLRTAAIEQRAQQQAQSDEMHTKHLAAVEAEDDAADRARKAEEYGNKKEVQQRSSQYEEAFNKAKNQWKASSEVDRDVHVAAFQAEYSAKATIEEAAKEKARLEQTEKQSIMSDKETEEDTKRKILEQNRKAETRIQNNAELSNHVAEGVEKRGTQAVDLQEEQEKKVEAYNVVKASLEANHQVQLTMVEVDKRIDAATTKMQALINIKQAEQGEKIAKLERDLDALSEQQRLLRQTEIAKLRAEQTVELDSYRQQLDQDFQGQVAAMQKNSEEQAEKSAQQAKDNAEQTNKLQKQKLQQDKANEAASKAQIRAKLSQEGNVKKESYLKNKADLEKELDESRVAERASDKNAHEQRIKDDVQRRAQEMASFLNTLTLENTTLLDQEQAFNDTRDKWTETVAQLTKAAQDRATAWETKENETRAKAEKELQKSYDDMKNKFLKDSTTEKKALIECQERQQQYTRTSEQLIQDKLELQERYEEAVSNNDSAKIEVLTEEIKTKEMENDVIMQKEYHQAGDCTQLSTAFTKKTAYRNQVIEEQPEKIKKDLDDAAAERSANEQWERDAADKTFKARQLAYDLIQRARQKLIALLAVQTTKLHEAMRATCSKEREAFKKQMQDATMECASQRDPELAQNCRQSVEANRRLWVVNVTRSCAIYEDVKCDAMKRQLVGRIQEGESRCVDIRVNATANGHISEARCLAYLAVDEHRWKLQFKTACADEVKKATMVDPNTSGVEAWLSSALSDTGNNAATLTVCKSAGRAYQQRLENYEDACNRAKEDEDEQMHCLQKEKWYEAEWYTALMQECPNFEPSMLLAPREESLPMNVSDIAVMRFATTALECLFLRRVEKAASQEYATMFRPWPDNQYNEWKLKVDGLKKTLEYVQKRIAGSKCPPLNELVDENRKVCASTGTSHMLNFKGDSFFLLGAGVFNLYEDEDMTVQIAAQFVSAWPQRVVITGVSVSDGDYSVAFQYLPVIEEGQSGVVGLSMFVNHKRTADLSSPADIAREKFGWLYVSHGQNNASNSGEVLITNTKNGDYVRLQLWAGRDIGISNVFVQAPEGRPRARGMCVTPYDNERPPGSQFTVPEIRSAMGVYVPYHPIADAAAIMSKTVLEWAYGNQTLVKAAAKACEAVDRVQFKDCIVDWVVAGAGHGVVEQAEQAALALQQMGVDRSRESPIELGLHIATETVPPTGAPPADQAASDAPAQADSEDSAFDEKNCPGVEKQWTELTTEFNKLKDVVRSQSKDARQLDDTTSTKLSAVTNSREKLRVHHMNCVEQNCRRECDSTQAENKRLECYRNCRCERLGEDIATLKKYEAAVRQKLVVATGPTQTRLNAWIDTATKREQRFLDRMEESKCRTTTRCQSRCRDVCRNSPRWSGGGECDGLSKQFEQFKQLGKEHCRTVRDSQNAEDCWDELSTKEEEWRSLLQTKCGGLPEDCDDVCESDICTLRDPEKCTDTCNNFCPAVNVTATCASLRFQYSAFQQQTKQFCESAPDADQKKECFEDHKIDDDDWRTRLSEHCPKGEAECRTDCFKLCNEDLPLPPKPATTTPLNSTSASSPSSSPAKTSKVDEEDDDMELFGFDV